MAQKYHFVLDISLAGQQRHMKLKLRRGSKPEDIHRSIRYRFDLPDDARLLLVDHEGCDVPIDDNLETGQYSLYIQSLAVAHKGRQLVVFVDQASHSRAAFATALEKVRPGDHLSIVHALEVFDEHKGISFVVANEMRRLHGEEILHNFAQIAASHGINYCTKIIGRAGISPREAAVTFVNDHHHDFDTVFTGTRGLLNGQQPVGSFSYYLVQHAKTTVMVVKNPSKGGRKLVAFVYGGRECRPAFAAALQQQKPADQLILAHCVTASPHDKKAIDAGQKVLDEFIKDAKSKGAKVEGRVLAHADMQPMEIAAGFANSSGADLVFVGTRGLEEDQLLTSFSHHLLQSVHGDVMIIRDSDMSLQHIYSGK